MQRLASIDIIAWDQQRFWDFLDESVEDDDADRDEKRDDAEESEIVNDFFIRDAVLKDLVETHLMKMTIDETMKKVEKIDTLCAHCDESFKLDYHLSRLSHFKNVETRVTIPLQQRLKFFLSNRHQKFCSRELFLEIFVFSDHVFRFHSVEI